MTREWVRVPQLEKKYYCQCTKSMENRVFLTAYPLVYFACTAITHSSLST